MVFLQAQYQYLVNNRDFENYTVHTFANQEFFLRLDAKVIQGQQCNVVGSLTAPPEQVVALLLLLHTIKLQKPARITLFSPYLGYQRQDLHQENSSFGLQWSDALLHAVGLYQVITIQAHCPIVLPHLQVPVISLSSELLFVQDMEYFLSLGFSFVFPDQGVKHRSDWILAKFPYAICGAFVKKRIHDMVVVEEFYGKVGRKVIIYDDILDSGQTLVQVCIALRQMGVEEIVIFVVHAFFHGHVWNQLWQLGVKFLYCTNSVPAAQMIESPYVKVKSIGFFLQNLP